MANHQPPQQGLGLWPLGKPGDESCWWDFHSVGCHHFRWRESGGPWVFRGSKSVGRDRLATLRKACRFSANFQVKIKLSRSIFSDRTSRRSVPIVPRKQRLPSSCRPQPSVRLNPRRKLPPNQRSRKRGKQRVFNQRGTRERKQGFLQLAGAEPRQRQKRRWCAQQRQRETAPRTKRPVRRTIRRRSCCWRKPTQSLGILRWQDLCCHGFLSSGFNIYIIYIYIFHYISI